MDQVIGQLVLKLEQMELPIIWLPLIRYLNIFLLNYAHCTNAQVQVKFMSIEIAHLNQDNEPSASTIQQLVYEQLWILKNIICDTKVWNWEYLTFHISGGGWQGGHDTCVPRPPRSPPICTQGPDPWHLGHTTNTDQIGFLISQEFNLIFSGR